MASGAAALGGCGVNITERDVDRSRISVEEVAELVRQRDAGTPEAVLLLDPRPGDEFAKGRIPGARNIPMGSVRTDRGLDARWEPYESIVVYGQNPAAASARGLTKRLLGVGYKEVRYFEPGFEGWERAGGRVERSHPE
jgi:ArsR family transcriptional regulator